MTFNLFAQKWLAVKQTEIKLTSYDTLYRTYTQYIVDEFGYKDLSEISVDDIQDLMISLLSQGLSISVIKKVHDFLSAMYKYAYFKGVVDRNPVALVKTPAQHLRPPKEIVILEPSEIMKIQETVNKRYSNGKLVFYYGYAYILMLNIGVRPSELLGLQWDDIDIKNRTIRIQRNVVTIKNHQLNRYEDIIQNTLKTKKSKRILFLNDTAITSLKILSENQIIRSKWVVAGKNGDFLRPQQLRRTFYRILDDACVKRNNLYCLRHTFASFLFKEGIELKRISELLGHSSIRITADTYVHLLPKEVDTSSMVLDSLFNFATAKL